MKVPLFVQMPRRKAPPPLVEPEQVNRAAVPPHNERAHVIPGISKTARKSGQQTQTGIRADDSSPSERDRHGSPDLAQQFEGEFSGG